MAPHAAAARGLMQPVHVLGHQQRQLLASAEPGQRLVAGVGPCPGHRRPAGHTARPVALAFIVTCNERLVLDGRRPLPAAPAITIIGNARSHGQAGPAEHEQPPMRIDEITQRSDIIVA